MEILTAYVRENSLRDFGKPRADINAILNVLKRRARTWDKGSLALGSTSLQGGHPSLERTCKPRISTGLTCCRGYFSTTPTCRTRIS
jgi:hypothetical protein